MWKPRPTEFKADTQILIECATELKFEFTKCFSVPSAVDWTGRHMLIFKTSILRIPVMEMSEPHSNTEKRLAM